MVHARTDMSEPARQAPRRRMPKSRMPKRYTRAGLLAILAMAVVPAVPAGAGAEELAPFRMQFGSLATPAGAAPFVAKDAGLYAKVGLDVAVQPGRLSQDTVNAVNAGTADIGFVLAINQILTADKGQRLVAVGNMYGRNAFGVVAAKDTGIGKLTDLEGHTIILPAGSYEALLRALIAAQGGNPDKVKYVTIPQPAAMLNSYIGKQADAVLTVIPFAYSGVEAARPSTYIPFADVGDPEPLYVWVVRPDTLARKKDQIRKFLTATYAATGMINANRSAMVEPYVKSVPGAQAERAIPDYERWMPYQCAEGQTVVGKPSAAAWDTAIALYRKVGLISSPLKAEELYTNEFFDGADPVSTVKCPQ